jgi:hypothetical protein
MLKPPQISSKSCDFILHQHKNQKINSKQVYSFWCQSGFFSLFLLFLAQKLTVFWQNLQDILLCTEVSQRGFFLQVFDYILHDCKTQNSYNIISPPGCQNYFCWLSFNIIGA